MASQANQGPQAFPSTDRTVEALKKFYHTEDVDIELFLPRARGADQSVATYQRRIDPNAPAQFGQQSVYDIDAGGDFAEGIVLELTVSAVTGVATPAFKRDASTIIDTIRLRQGGTQLQEVHRYDSLAFKNITTQSIQNYQIKQPAEGILPQATRLALAAAPQTFFIQIPTCLDQLSVPISSLKGDLKLEISFKPLVNCVQWAGAGTPTATILSQNLRITYTSAPLYLLQRIRKASENKGLVFPFVENWFTSKDIAAGATTDRYLLSDSKGPTYLLGGWLREARQVDDTTGNLAFEVTNTAPITAWNLLDKGMNMLSNPDDQTYGYQYLYHRPRDVGVYADPARYNVDYTMLHAFGLESEQVVLEEQTTARGYWDASLTQSANLSTTFPVNANALRLNAYGWAFNAFILENGRLTRFYS